MFLDVFFCYINFSFEEHLAIKETYKKYRAQLHKLTGTCILFLILFYTGEPGFDLPFPSLELYLASPSGHNGILLHSAWLGPALFPAVAQSLHCIVNCIYATKFAEIYLV